MNGFSVNNGLSKHDSVMDCAHHFSQMRWKCDTRVYIQRHNHKRSEHKQIDKTSKIRMF